MSPPTSTNLWAAGAKPPFLPCFLLPTLACLVDLELCLLKFPTTSFHCFMYLTALLMQLELELDFVVFYLDSFFYFLAFFLLDFSSSCFPLLIFFCLLFSYFFSFLSSLVLQQPQHL